MSAEKSAFDKIDDYKLAKLHIFRWLFATFLGYFKACYLLEYEIYYGIIYYYLLLLFIYDYLLRDVKKYILSNTSLWVHTT